MSDQFTKISLDNIGNGGASALFERGLKDVIENINDLSTNPKTPRKIVIEFAFGSDIERKQIECHISSKLKLAPLNGVSETLYPARRDGEDILFQTNFAETDLFDRKTGELREVV